MKTETIGVWCFGQRFGVVSDGVEVAHAYLYVLKNDLHSDPFGLLEDVFVGSDMRGQGVGSELVRKVIAAAKEADCYKLIATSRTKRQKVHDLYIKLGFMDYGKEFRIDF